VIVIIAGPSGSGKTTIGTGLAGRLGWIFADADTFHSAAAIAKMHRGEPLTDADRWPWLATVAAWMDERIERGESAVMACSVLKRSYREFLCRGRPTARVVLLDAGEDLLRARLAARRGHFFPAALLRSQLADLEMPAPGEHVLVVPATGSPAETAADIIGRLGLGPAPG
jgi:gluconokinase